MPFRLVEIMAFILIRKKQNLQYSLMKKKKKGKKIINELNLNVTGL